MSLYLKVSNSLTSLATGLSKNLEESGNGVFDPHVIVTQTEGMNNWLKFQIAGNLGIAANCRFLKPNDLINKLYYLLGGVYPEMLSVKNLNWLLFSLLDEKDFKARFPSIASYFSESGPDKEIKRMALAEKLSDLFDQYQIYRPDMIRLWNNSELEQIKNNEWQQWLWIKARQVTQNKLPDKTTVGAYILEAIQNPELQATLIARLPAIHLFGLSITTDYHLQILFKLSSLIDIYFHIINPAPLVYWFEDAGEKQKAIWNQKGLTHLAGSIAGNTLLTGWGRVIQETFGMLFKHDEFLNAYEDVDILPPLPDNLLHKIQHDIFSSATDDRNLLSNKDINDGSVTINACYTISREVEVLYNYLVFLVDKKKGSLSPRDIVVMVSDIDAYSPYIKAVFNNAPFKFRYTIADESYADSDNIFQALHSILVINENNFKAETVMQLLDSSYIRNRFKLTDITNIRHVVDAANIRFGIDGDTENETHFVSWRYGISRIMFGICMSGEEEYGEGMDSFYPLDLLEGGSAQELIRFCHFAGVLIDSIEERDTVRNIAGWVTYMEQVMLNLVYEQDEEPDENYNTLIKQLDEYNVVNQYMNEHVPFDVFNHSFLKSLSGTSRSGLFVNGGITFCSLIPMRSIPFKVVALLGLGFDKFPRREQADSFNLMEKKRQRGDRNVKENDKHLFLETILSAQKYLYISFTGRNARDNTSMPPSAIVDEFIEYIEAGTHGQEDTRKQLITLQPLQGFSTKYIMGNSRWYSYLNSASMPIESVINPAKVIDTYTFEEISLDDLVKFFKSPFKSYYNRVLGIYYNQDDILLRETEIFSLDNLQQWSIKKQLLPLDENEKMSLQKRLVRIGHLPLSHMADVIINETDEMVKPIRELFKQITLGREEQSISFELEIGNHLLKGNMDGIYDKKLLQISWSKSESKYLIEAYIRYLAGVAAGIITGLSFISAEKQEVYNAFSLTKLESLNRLKELIDIYIRGFESIVGFHPDFELRPDKAEALDFDGFSKLVKTKLAVEGSRIGDSYILKEFENGYFSQEGVYEEYKSICDKVILPLAEIFPEYYEK